MSRFLSYTNSLGQEFVFKDVLLLNGFDYPELNMVSESDSGQDGESYLGTYLKARELEISFDVYETDARAMPQIRREIIHKLSPKYGEGSLRYVYGGKDTRIKCAVSSVSFTKRSTKMHSVLVRLQAFSDPYFADAEQTVFNLKFSQGLLVFPVALPCALGKQADAGYIDNVGDAPSSVVIRIHGSATNPAVKCKTTGEVIRINGTIKQGEVLEVDTEIGVKSITLIEKDGTKTNAFSMLDPHSALWYLPVGTSEIEFTTDDDASDSYGTLTYYNKYVGI